MALQIQHTDYTPNWNGAELDLRARGNDDYDTIWGGTSSFDFARADLMPSSLFNDDTLVNLRSGQGPAIAKNVQNGNGTAKLTDIAGDGGLKFGTALTGATNVDLPESFDLLNMGAEASTAIWAWINLPATTSAGIFGIAGFGKFNDGLHAQWILGTNAGNFTASLGGGNAVLTTATWAQMPGEHLLSVVLSRQAAALWSAKVYDNTTLVGSLTGAYPFHDPKVGDAMQVPKMGLISGGSGAAPVIQRRIGMRQVNPATYGQAEHEAWIAQQIAANGGRW